MESIFFFLPILWGSFCNKNDNNEHLKTMLCICHYANNLKIIKHYVKYGVYQQGPYPKLSHNLAGKHTLARVQLDQCGRWDTTNIFWNTEENQDGLQVLSSAPGSEPSVITCELRHTSEIRILFFSFYTDDVTE